MGQVNVNTPGGGTAGEPPGSTGAGMILGIIIAIIVIAALVWFLVLGGGTAPGDGTDGGGTDTTDGGGTEPTDGGTEPTDAASPSGWRLVDLA